MGVVTISVDCARTGSGVFCTASVGEGGGVDVGDCLGVGVVVSTGWVTLGVTVGVIFRLFSIVGVGVREVFGLGVGEEAAVGVGVTGVSCAKTGDVARSR